MEKNFKFYVGSLIPNWLWTQQNRVPLFVSRRTLIKVKKLKPSNGRWCCDSGGFTELSLHGKWTISPAQYVEELNKFNEKISNMDWAAPQDYMCEPNMLEKTGLTVQHHQRLTCENFLELQSLQPDVRIIPVLQGWDIDEYWNHIDMYMEYGIDLRNYETVGMGTFCRRSNMNELLPLVIGLEKYGIKMHGFGLNLRGVQMFGSYMQSSDSTAWNKSAILNGRKGIYLCGRQHDNAKDCSSCHEWSMMYGERATSLADIFTMRDFLNK